MMNSLILCSKRPTAVVLKLINKKNNVNLSLPKISHLVFKKKIKSEAIKLHLEPIPEEWPSYSI